MRKFFAQLIERFMKRFDKIECVLTKEVEFQKYEGLKIKSRMIVGMYVITRFDKVLKSETLYTMNSSFPSYGWMFEDGTKASYKYGEAYSRYAAEKTTAEEKARNLENIDKAKKIINLGG
jgi:hypothetical protein